jgi:hypothetical protein
MNDANAFLVACDEQKRLLGKMRMLWAYHKLHEVDDAENHVGAKEWYSVSVEASENAVLLKSLAEQAVDAVRQAKYDPAMLFELAETAGSWDRFNEALRKILPSLKAASVLAEAKPVKTYPQPKLLLRDEFIWQNIVTMRMKQLIQALENKKNFWLTDAVKTLKGFKDAALRYSQYHRLPTRTFRSETPYMPSDTD